MNSRTVLLGFIGAALISALLLSGCSAEREPSVTPETATHAAERLLPTVLAHPDGVLRESSGTVTAGAPVQYYLVPDGATLSFASLEARDYYEVPLVDSAGQPVGAFGLGNRDAKGQLLITGVDDGDQALLVATEVQRLRTDLGSGAQFKVVGSMTGYWIAARYAGGEFGVPVFNANGATRTVGKRYPLSEFAKQ
ncbi:MAG TPA: hypothetical protein VIL17_07190 [Coriobacteriia bacterium]